MALDVQISYSWTDYCRLCLLDSGIMVSLFEEEGKNLQLAHKIETCLQLVTYAGDPLPRKICHKCLFQINQMYEFRTLAMSSFERIRLKLLPLKHVPDVQLFLNKTEHLHRSVDFNGELQTFPTPSTSSKYSPPQDQLPKIRIKSEGELLSQTNTSWLSPPPPQPPPEPVVQDSLPSSTSHLSPPLSFDFVSESSDLVSSPENKATCSESSKRKRPPSSPNSKCDKSLPALVQRVLKKKKQLAGPASKKRGLQNSWKCQFCHLDFVSNHSLKVHVDQCLKCSTCKQEFPSLFDKAIHEAEKHISVYIDCDISHLCKQCPACPSHFASSIMLSTHYKYEHDQPHATPAVPYPIRNRNQSANAAKSDRSSSGVFLMPQMLPQSRESSPTTIQCASVKEDSNEISLPSLLSCAPTPASGDFFCKICYESFDSHQVLQDHYKLIHGRYKCLLCSEVFESQNGLNSHQRYHYNKDTAAKKATVSSTSVKKKNLSCHTCYEEFDEEDAFILHLYEHACEESDDESIPRKKTRRTQNATKKTSIVVETDVVENSAEQFSVKCERCHVVCRSKEYYKVHLATHMSKSKTSFPCSACNQDFRNVEALNRHTCCGKPDNTESCCLDCGQALCKDEEHVCDNKCPVCEKVFKSARGQRLHFVHKHQMKLVPEDCDYDSQVLDTKSSCNEENLSVLNENSAEKSPIHFSESESAYSDAEAKSVCEQSPPVERLPPEGASLEPTHDVPDVNVMENKESNVTRLSPVGDDFSSVVQEAQYSLSNNTLNSEEEISSS